MEPTQTPQLESTPPRKSQPKLLGILAILLAVVVVVVTGWLAWSAWNDRNDEETPTAEISISADGFTPSTIRIKKGSDVTWTNKDGNARSVKGDEDNLGLNTTDPLSQGSAYSFMFEQSGTFTYHDPTHPTAKGTIIVE